MGASQYRFRTFINSQNSFTIDILLINKPPSLATKEHEYSLSIFYLKHIYYILLIMLEYIVSIPIYLVYQNLSINQILIQ